MEVYISLKDHLSGKRHLHSTLANPLRKRAWLDLPASSCYFQTSIRFDRV